MFLNKCLEERTLQCELCKNLTPMGNVYVCESGHTICINCDDIQNDKIDDIVENKLMKEFAGGDNFKIKPEAHINKHYSQSTHSKEDEDRNSVHSDCDPDKCFEASVKYKNLNYHDSASSIIFTSLEKKCSYHDIAQNISIRPIVCPILNCQKTVATDSILKHFSFDHSKIPKLPLIIGKSLKIKFKLSNLSMNTKCIAIINPVGSNSLLLLMGAKIVDAYWKIIVDKQISETEITSQSHSKIKTRTIHHNNRDYFNLKENETDKDVLLWICVLTDYKHICSITVKRKHILSYNYAGEGLPVQNKQDPISVSKSPECLIIRHQSIAKLLDVQGQIHIYVNIFK